MFLACLLSEKAASRQTMGCLEHTHTLCHTIATSYRYTHTAQVYRHMQVYKSRHQNASPDAQNTSPDAQKTNPNTHKTNPDF